MRLETVNLTGKARERIERLRETVLNSMPEICIERAVAYTDIYKAYEALPQITKRSLAFEKFLETIPIYIRPDELIVGAEGPVSGSVHVFPEIASEWIEEELELFEQRPPHSRFVLSAESKEKLRELLPYWRGRAVVDRGLGLFPPEVKSFVETGVFASVSGLVLGLGHLIPNYSLILEKGLNSVIEDIRIKKENLNPANPAQFEAILFYDAAERTCKAVIRLAERYSQRANELAAVEENTERRNELIRISAICSRVPAKPAETFYEALQSFWLVHMAIMLESNGAGVSPGRFDQYIYSFLSKDIAGKRIDYPQALELLECLWIKFNEMNRLMNQGLTDLIQSYPSRQNLVLGGLTKDGDDATNELSYLCLKATADIKFPQPSLSVRYHMNSPDQFMIDVAKVIRLGLGLPALYNDEAHIPALMSRGVALDDARNYALVGCVEPAPSGKGFPNAAGSKFNFPKCLELTLGNGVDPVSGNKIGLETGKDFDRFEEFFAAYKVQIVYAIKQLVVAENVIEMAHRELAPLPWLSILVEGCIEQGKEVLAGGARYNFTGPQGVGLATIADSLAVIKKLVFEERKTTLAELRQMLSTNFADNERYRQMLINLAPKFGNDDDYVDMLAREAMEIYALELEKYINPRGGPFHAGMFPASANVSLGLLVGATPDGRYAGEPLPDGISPVQGRDSHGMTAVFNSVAKLNHLRTSNGTLLNQKIHPAVLESEEGLKKLVMATRAFFARRSMHVQYNVVSSEMLRDAQLNPDKYRGLVVRVSGWSAFWASIDKALQDEIISRTEHRAI
ncbi:MAG: glycyl radical protein [Bacillota bacterium]